MCPTNFEAFLAFPSYLRSWALNRSATREATRSRTLSYYSHSTCGESELYWNVTSFHFIICAIIWKKLLLLSTSLVIIQNFLNSSFFWKNKFYQKGASNNKSRSLQTVLFVLSQTCETTFTENCWTWNFFEVHSVDIYVKRFREVLKLNDQKFEIWRRLGQVIMNPANISTLFQSLGISNVLKMAKNGIWSLTTSPSWKSNLSIRISYK